MGVPEKQGGTYFEQGQKKYQNPADSFGRRWFTSVPQMQEAVGKGVSWWISNENRGCL
nr:MAG TPA: hypothetical protein [Caudoviricetes sp.]